MSIFVVIMGIIEVFLIAVGVSMDAFAVSVAKGISAVRFNWRNALIAGLWFGGFQALMPMVGYFLGTGFASYVTKWDHWIAWALLMVIGGNMLRSSLFGEEEKYSRGFSFKVMFPLAIATSIDALAIGVSFAFLNMSIWLPVLIIGLTTMVFSIAGVCLGRIFGLKFKAKAEFIGGLVLMIIGCKILWEHTLGA